MRNEIRGDLDVFAIKNKSEHVETMPEEEFVSLIEYEFKILVCDP
jgi:hypothetical protein